ncbi:MAG TPA: DUF933 domain-containing protein [Nitrosomonas sp.]|nr:DUF933 domain-containing protein [Nitrosomonas sp.]
MVAKTSTGEYHAIQCKLYDEDYRLQKGDIDSFFTASGKKAFTHRIIVGTTNHWSEHGAKEAGKMRLEGKEYIVKDGDVMHFRFNV